MKLRKLLGGVLAVLTLATVLAVPAAAQQGINRNIAFQADYSKWTDLVTSGTSVSGAATITVYYGTVTTPGGVEFSPFSTSNPITIVDANTETVTPSAVSGCTTGVYKSCNLTATFSNAHPAGAFVKSGSNGLQEAIADVQGRFNGGLVYGDSTELLVLATGSVNSDTVANLLPANSFIDTVTGLVTTTITGTCSGWTLADPTSAGRFAASNVTLTAGTTSIGTVHRTTGVASAATGPFQSAAAKVRVVCATGNASAGAIRIRVHYVVVVPALS